MILDTKNFKKVIYSVLKQVKTEQVNKILSKKC